MVLHRAVGEHQAVGDLTVRQALGDQPEHLGLPGGELRGGGGGRAGGQAAELAEHQAGQARGEDRVAEGGAADGVDQFVPVGGLDQVAGGAGLHRLQYVGVLAAGGEHEHPDGRVLGDGLAADLDAGQGGQVEVEHDHLGGAGPGPADRLLAVPGGGHHVEAGVGQVPGDRLAPHRVVVDHHDPYLTVHQPSGLSGVPSPKRRVRGTRSSISTPSPGAEYSSAVPPRSSSRPRMDWETPSRPARSASASRPAG